MITQRCRKSFDKRNVAICQNQSIIRISNASSYSDIKCIIHRNRTKCSNRMRQITGELRIADEVSGGESHRLRSRMRRIPRCIRSRVSGMSVPAEFRCRIFRRHIFIIADYARRCNCGIYSVRNQISAREDDHQHAAGAFVYTVDICYTASQQPVCI